MASVHPDDETAPVHRVGTLVRRLTLGPDPDTLDTLVDRGVDGVLDDLLGDTRDLLEDTEARRLEDIGDDDAGYEDLVTYALTRIATPGTGLHERLVWYWHGHFTTSLDKVPAPLVVRQHLTIRRLALGDFRQLVSAMLRDPAMLVYLDGDGSGGDDPNENLARELLELFTLGRGHYGETDVRAAARALSGWWVDGDTGEALFDPDAHAAAVGTFLGARVNGVDDVVDAVCDHTACAPFVAGRLFRHLVGAEPSPERLRDLAAVFRRADLALFPLVEAIASGPEIHDHRWGRPTLPLEWLATACRAVGARGDEIDPWFPYLLGQLPFHPPDVAGWPLDGRWVTGHQLGGRLALALELIEAAGADGVDVPDAATAVALCGRTWVSPTTRSVLDGVADGLDPELASALRLACALVSPEVSIR